MNLQKSKYNFKKWKKKEKKYRFKATVYNIKESLLKVCTVNLWEAKGEKSPAKHGKYFNSMVFYHKVNSKQTEVKAIHKF